MIALDHRLSGKPASAPTSTQHNSQRELEIDHEPTYRTHLPQLDGGLFLTDGGIETTLIFHDGLELPHFAAFHLLKDEAGRAALARYFARYAEIARAQRRRASSWRAPTWRASADWGEKLGYSASALAEANRAAIALMQELRAEYRDRAAADRGQRLRRPARRRLRSRRGR